ncbi:MAG: 1,4-dihydroxy-2-naphthoate polyprenyltransferase [Kofleriaceae bacterium]|nr:1,4-dihydroxy-2-naphthoate polyprenyltransferase [Kofleriaceae bacterium]MCL4222864.1 1,4-dihydroxy-2-naphthoate polyprenyltransferase [Myxococcales bacterium]
MTALAHWVAAARPRTLTAAVAPVAIGTACAHAAGGVAWGPAAAALAGAALIQIGTNFANDVFDAEKGADTAARKGPVRAVAAGLISAAAMRAAMVVTFGLAVAVGSYLVAIGGWPIVAIGVASVAAGVAYTGGPWPLGYHGLGDLFVMIFFGQVAVCGTAYVQVGAVPALAWWLSLPVGAIATAVLVVNNLRDRETDAVAGKRTLAVRFGRRFALVEYGALLAVAHAVPLGLAATGRPWCALGVATAPWALALVRALARAAPGPAMNRLLGATAQLLLAQSLLVAAGLALG